MSYRYHELLPAPRPVERQVGQPAPAQHGPRPALGDQRSSSDIHEQVERVYWLMQREPMLERRREV